MDPVQIRVAIPAADPPDNISHDFLTVSHQAALRVRLVADLPG